MMYSAPAAAVDRCFVGHMPLHQPRVSSRIRSHSSQRQQQDQHTIVAILGQGCCVGWSPGHPGDHGAQVWTSASDAAKPMSRVTSAPTPAHCRRSSRRTTAWMADGLAILSSGCPMRQAASGLSPVPRKQAADLAKFGSSVGTIRQVYRVCRSRRCMPAHAALRCRCYNLDTTWSSVPGSGKSWL